LTLPVVTSAFRPHCSWPTVGALIWMVAMLIRVPITQEQYEGLKRPINLHRSRWGGFQHLIYRLQCGVKWYDGKPCIEMERADADRALEYSKESYGSGTYQSQLRPLVPAIKAILEYLPKPVKQESLFGDADV
jgi:hypothetical protein